MGAPSAAYSGGVVVEFVGGIIAGISAIVIWDVLNRWRSGRANHVAVKVRRLRLQPGDIVFLETQEDLTAAECANLMDQWNHATDLDNKVLCLTRGMTVRVVSPQAGDDA